MILVLGGTTEAKQLTELLLKEGYPVVVSTAYDFAKEYIPENPLLELLTGKLNSSELQQLIEEKSINIVLDATHPFALEISENAKKACLAVGANYFRFEREEVAGILDSPYAKLHRVDSALDAAKVACKLGRVLFFATGSNDADKIIKNIDVHCKRYIRVLPNDVSRAKCLEAGFKESEVVTGVGPFSYEENFYLWQRLKVDVVVTKESGSAGGFGEKFEAARNLNIHLVVIDRPKTKGLATNKAQEIIDHLKPLMKG